MTQRNLLVIAGLIFIIAIGAIWFLSGDKAPGSKSSSGDRGVPGDPANIVLDFYQPWLTAAAASNTDPFTLNLHNAPELSVAMSEQLEQVREIESEMDPVLCQTTLPGGLRARPTYQQENKVEILVTAAEKGFQGQAAVTLEREGDLWSITKISCSTGESAPDREFSFEHEGLLLKSVPPPLDPQHWHIVFEENGVMGHTAPLFFTDESRCVSPDGSEGTCNPDSFTEAKAVFVQGEMTEAGVEVKWLKHLN